jgi:hypothetical protein
VKNKLRFLKSLPLLVLLFAAGAAQADITVFTDRASFAAAVSSSQLVDTFDDLPVGLYVAALPLVRSVGRISAGSSAGIDTFSGVDGGGGDMWLSTSHPGQSVGFWNLNARYGPAGAGVGGNFFGTDDFGAVAPGTIDVTILATDGSETVRLVNPTPDTFVGFVASSPVQISVTPIEGLFHVTANNFTLAPAVPEPETYAMLLAGLGLLGFVARRRNITRSYRYATE